jgi:hypothetical protein
LPLGAFRFTLNEHSFTMPKSSQGTAQKPVADKREAILRAATHVFARNGYFNSKVADIAGAAGTSNRRTRYSTRYSSAR